jgi:hypothetical protein
MRSAESVAPRPERYPLAAENDKLRRRNQQLEEELRKAQVIIEVQRKSGLSSGSWTSCDAGTLQLLMVTAEDLGQVSTKHACAALAIPRATLYRRRLSPPPFSSACGREAAWRARFVRIGEDDRNGMPA